MMGIIKSRKGCIGSDSTLKEALKRKTNAQNTNVRVAIGSMVSVVTYVAWQSLKGGDDDEEQFAGDEENTKDKTKQFKRWLFAHPALKKYFNFMAPTGIAMVIAAENGDLTKELGKILGVRGDIFDDGVKMVKAIGLLYESVDVENKKILDQEKYNKAKGEFGKLVGNKANVPLPWRTIRDVENVYRSLRGLPVIKTDYKAKGFTDGLSKGGFIEWLITNPDEIKKEEDQVILY